MRNMIRIKETNRFNKEIEQHFIYHWELNATYSKLVQEGQVASGLG